MIGVITPLSAPTFMTWSETNLLLLGYVMSSLKFSVLVFQADTRSIWANDTSRRIRIRFLYKKDILWNNQQMQLYAVNFIPLLGSLYTFRVFYTPIIRITLYNFIYSLFHSRRSCRVTSLRLLCELRMKYLHVVWCRDLQGALVMRL